MDIKNGSNCYQEVRITLKKESSQNKENSCGKTYTDFLIFCNSELIYYVFIFSQCVVNNASPKQISTKDLSD